MVLYRFKVQLVSCYFGAFLCQDLVKLDFKNSGYYDSGYYDCYDVVSFMVLYRFKVQLVSCYFGAFLCQDLVKFDLSFQKKER